MNRLIKSILSFNYKYHYKIWIKLAYLTAVLSFTALLYLNLLTLLIILNSDPGGVHWWGSGDSAPVKYTKAAIIFIVPTTVIVKLFFRKKMLEKLKADNRRISKGYLYLLVYFVFSLLLFAAAI